MLEKDITISNRLGLHARASAKLVQALHGFQSLTSIAYRGKEVNAKSIMGVMMLAAGLGAQIRLQSPTARTRKPRWPRWSICSSASSTKVSDATATGWASAHQCG